MNTPWKAALGVLLIFLLGWLFGVVTASAFLHHRIVRLLEGGPAGVTAVLERPLTRNLDLDPDQKTKVHDLLVQYFTERWELQKQLQPQLQTLNRQTLAQFDAVLRPGQQERFRINLALIRQHTGRNIFFTLPDSTTPDSTTAETNAPAGAAPASPSHP